MDIEAYDQKVLALAALQQEAAIARKVLTALYLAFAEEDDALHISAEYIEKAEDGPLLALTQEADGSFVLRPAPQNEG